MAAGRELLAVRRKGDVPDSAFKGIQRGRFDALGRPDNPSNKDEFAGFSVEISGDGSSRSVGVTLETGYVF